MRTMVLAWFFVMAFCMSTSAQDKLPPTDELPIIAWMGVPEGQTSVDRFNELKESGINVNFSWYSKVEAVEKALDVAQQTGVKLMPFCPELKSEPEKTVKRLMNHPALFAYHLRDEPANKDFPALKEWVERIQAVDTKIPCYINLYPHCKYVESFFDKDAMPENPYKEHVELFLREVPVTFLSFDHYPITEKDGIRSIKGRWYENLEIISAAARERDMPFWAFALSSAHDNSPNVAPGNPYPVPTIGDLKLQMYSNLAYGAQALQYFTYWGRPPSWMKYEGEDGGPTTHKGKRTVIYDRIKAVNTELRQRAGVFLGSQVVFVAHIPGPMPEYPEGYPADNWGVFVQGPDGAMPKGTKPLGELPGAIKKLDTHGSGAIVSLLQKEKRQFLVIVNRDCQKPMKLLVETEDHVKKVQKDGTLVPANCYYAVTEVDPGDAVIYTWE